MFLINCPNCGKRNVSEFRCGGEVNPRPSDLEARSDEAWADYVYMRENTPGIVREWWYHRMGCGEWFLAERNATTHEVLRTYFRDEERHTGDDRRGAW